MDPILFICSSVGGHLGCRYLLAVVNHACYKHGCKYLFESPLSILLGVYPGVELLDHMVISCSVF